MPIPVAVFGAGGRLGSALCTGIDAAEDLDLVARLGRSDPRQGLLDAGAEVAVDVTHPDAVMDNVAFCVEHGIHVVVGTSGIDEGRQERVAGLLADAPGVGVLLAPNFSLGAVLMMRFARQAARFMEAAEIIELHHAGKADAPSGTAARTAELLADAWATSGPPEPRAGGDPAHETAGARGADVAGVRVHSVRLPGLVAHQEVILGGESQTLTIRHDSMSTASFTPGALLAIRQVGERPGLTAGLEHLLDLD